MAAYDYDERNPEDPDYIPKDHDEEIKDKSSEVGDEPNAFSVDDFVEDCVEVEAENVNPEQIIFQITGLAKELEQTTKSEWRNAVLEALKIQKYMSAEEACISYFQSWHFEKSKKTIIINDIYNLLVQLRGKSPELFRENRERAVDDFDDEEKLEEQFGADIEIQGDKIVRKNGKNTPVNLKDIANSPALMKKLEKSLKPLQKQTSLPGGIDIVVFQGEPGENTISVSVNRQDWGPNGLKILMQYEDAQKAFLDFFEIFKPAIKIVENSIVRDDGKNTPVRFNEIAKSPKLAEKLMRLFSDLTKKDVDDYRADGIQIEFEGESGETAVLRDRWGSEVEGTLEDFMQIKKVQSAFWRDLKEKFGTQFIIP